MRTDNEHMMEMSRTSDFDNSLVIFIHHRSAPSIDTCTPPSIFSTMRYMYGPVDTVRQMYSTIAAGQHHELVPVFVPARENSIVGFEIEKTCAVPVEVSNINGGVGRTCCCSPCPSRKADSRRTVRDASEIVRLTEGPRRGSRSRRRNGSRVTTIFYIFFRFIEGPRKWTRTCRRRD